MKVSRKQGNNIIFIETRRFEHNLYSFSRVTRNSEGITVEMESNE